MKEVKVAKRARPHYKKFAPASKKVGQSRKGGKGTSLMHVAAKRQSAAEVADSNVTPQLPVSGEPAPNRADYALSRLSKNHD